MNSSNISYNLIETKLQNFWAQVRPEQQKKLGQEIALGVSLNSHSEGIMEIIQHSVARNVPNLQGSFDSINDYYHLSTRDVQKKVRAALVRYFTERNQ